MAIIPRMTGSTDSMAHLPPIYRADISQLYITVVGSAVKTWRQGNLTPAPPVCSRAAPHLAVLLAALARLSPTRRGERVRQRRCQGDHGGGARRRRRTLRANRPPPVGGLRGGAHV